MKRKILACVVACATLFLGMGYAYWTDSLQIDTTASTGELEVKFVDTALFGQYGSEEKGWSVFNGVVDNPAAVTNFFNRGTQYNIAWEQVDLDTYNAAIEDYTKTTFDAKLDPATLTDMPADVEDGGVYDLDWTHVSDGIEIAVNKIYPGYAQYFRSDILNTGTLAARLADIDLTINSADNDTIKKMIGVSLVVQREDGTTVKEFDYSGLTADTDYFEVGQQKFVRLSYLDTAELANIVHDLLYIYPGDNTFDVYLGVAMDGDYDGDFTTGHVGLANTGNYDVNSQNAKADFTIKFAWDQFNTKYDPDAPKAPVVTP